MKASGDMHTEQKMAITNEFQPTGFFDADVWGRAIIDLLLINHERKAAVIVDWKFGKMKDDWAQLDLFICFIAVYFPELESYAASFYWAKEKKFVTKKVKREDVPELWNGILPRIARLDNAIKTTDFPANPSGLCKKYCNVTSCVHHGVGGGGW